MISFAKHIAVLAAAFLVATAWADKSSDDPSPKPGVKAAGEKKSKKKKNTEDPDAPKKIDVPVAPGHPSKGMQIPYFDSSGKRQMNFHIGVASRLDDNHVEMTDLQVETFNEDGQHELQIDLPTAVLDTESSVITSRQHVTIERHDFKLTGEAMIFHTRTKQGGLGGKVHMTIFNLTDEVSGSAPPAESKEAAPTPEAKEASNAPASPEKTNTPEPKAK